jgi:hypothetical protein
MHFQSGLLKVDASGEFSLEDAKQAFREMLGGFTQYKAEKILFDGQNRALCFKTRQSLKRNVIPTYVYSKSHSGGIRLFNRTPKSGDK